MGSKSRKPDDTSRRDANIWSVLITVAVLVVTFAISDADGNFANSIHKITENLDKALVDILGDGDITYTDINDRIPYVNYTRVEFDAVGMTGFYNVTQFVIDLVVSEVDLSELHVNSTSIDPEKYKMENIIETLKNTKGLLELLKSTAGLVVLLVVLALMAVLFPLCGLCFCCCRGCCGRCGGRKQIADKKGDLCKKIMHGTLLIALGTSLLFCVVCAFGSNQQFYDGLQEFPSNMKKSVKDTSRFFNNTKTQMTTLLSTNFKEFNHSLVNIMEKSSSAVVNELMEFSNATSMTSLATFVNDIPKIRDDMDLLRQSTNDLRVRANNLNDAMRKLKHDLLITLNECKLQECSDFKRQVGNLQTNIDFDKYVDRYFPRLPDISDEIAAFKEFKIEELQAAARSGMDKLDKVKSTIHNEFQKNINEAQKHLVNAGRTIDKNLKRVTEMIDDVNNQLQNNANPNINTAEFYIKRYGVYVHYTGTGIACCLLAVSFFICLGLMWGICGKRPDGFNDNCCNKGAGSKMLICGVSVMFITGFVFAVVAIVLCIIGVGSQKLVCQPLRQPEQSKVITFLNKSVNLKRHGGPESVLHLYESCKRNETVYKVLNLEQKFGLRDIIAKFDINQTLDGLNFDRSVPDNFYILDHRSREVLRKLAKSSAEFNFDKFESELENNNYTTISLEDVKKQLKAVIEKAPESLKSDLNLSLLHLDSYDEKILQPMIKTATQAKEIANSLGTSINMGKASLADAINDLIDEITKAEGTIKNEGKAHLIETAKKFISSVKALVNGYVNRVTGSIERDVGKCEHLYRVYDFSLVSTCDKVVLPLNGYWLNLFFTLILYIPTIIICVRLATIYQKRRSNGLYVEAEYLYDAYSDRDNIPLNRHKRHKKNTKKKAKRYEDRPQNVGGEVVAREYATGSHQDTRYSDMAPKHWEEFPAGGPPQYQRAPTEYERPPPYYYPGASGEN
ncbi:prominin-like protein isoform X2 [Aethina tumida]|uniref:prominin-like protein isoform X2 n=1 Tax=Aethina tumida TaxID=116153 RepID=UPI00096ADBCC|nr:prominin-like protein isoform X2 [Aethina tumida]